MFRVRRAPLRSRDSAQRDNVTSRFCCRIGHWLKPTQAKRRLGWGTLCACHPCSVAAYSPWVVVAFWPLISSSFTTCFTFGTSDAAFSTSARFDCEVTVPFNVTTPFFTS
jgi:hypothetical protein